MSNYTNFIQDFPSRSLAILKDNFDRTKASGREVTLMLSIASTAFIVPFERLKADPEKHPANDVEKYKKAKEKFSDMINEKFLSSELCGGRKSWEFIAEINSGDVQKKETDEWARKENRKPLSEKKEINSVLSHLRNALAHGSIFTYPSGSSGDKQIKTILFVSRCYEKTDKCEYCGNKERKPANKYDVLLVSPDDFLIFLEKWVDFLKDLNLKGNTIIQETILPGLESEELEP